MFSKIKHRVLFIFISVGLLPLANFMVWEYYQSQERLRERSYEQLKTVREIKKKEIEWYFEKLRDEAVFFSQSNLVIKAMNDFKKSFNDLKSLDLPADYTQKLNNYYQEKFEKKINLIGDSFSFESLVPVENPSIILQNQYLIGTKENFKNIPYFEEHNKYHNSISSFINTYDLYDLILIEDETGYIVYSVLKEIDFGTSLLSGVFADSNLGKLYRKIRYTGLKSETLMCDFERYLPSNFAPSAFIAAPVFDGEKKIGTLILQVPLNKMDEITTGRKAWIEEGLGDTGETYIVGSDYRMRTDSRFIIESINDFIKEAEDKKTASPKEIECMRFYKSTVLFQKVNTETVEKALAKTSGIKTITDYRGKEVLSAYSPLNIKDASWVILAEIDADEIFYSMNQTAKESILILIIVTITLIIVSILLARTIYKPIMLLASGTAELGKGNFEVVIDVNSKDELGLLANTLNTTIKSLKEQREEILSKNSLLDQQKSELRAQSDNLKSLNDSIIEINRQLDEKVKERTLKLEQQNEKLFEYANFNSHKLRAPVATILGLLTLIKMSNTENDLHIALESLDKATKELDQIIHQMQHLIDEAEFTE